jgi:hypothetical protein
LETLALSAGEGLPLAAVREQVAAAVDTLVGVARGTGGTRAVVSLHDLVDGRLRPVPATERRDLPLVAGR